MGRLQRLKVWLTSAGVMLMVLPALALILFGPRTSRDIPPGRVVVTYWEKWTDFEGEAMRNLVRFFNETVGQETNIYVDYVVTTQVDLKALVATAGGDPPDLVGLWPRNVASFAARGALLPLAERVRASGIDAEMIIPVYTRGCRYHDQIYALPLTPWSVALYYNKSILREFDDELKAAGYSAERPPRTLDDLMGYCRIIHRRDPEGEIEMMGYLPGRPETFGWYWHTWGLWFGGSFTDPATRLASLDSDPFMQGYDWVQEFARHFGTRAVTRFESGLANFNSPDNPFMVRKLAMLRQGPWFANMIRQYGPDIDYGVAPFPSSDGSEVSYCGQDVLAIPTGAKDPDAAWVFIEWLYTHDPIVVPSGKAEPQFGYEYCTVSSHAGVQRRPMPALRPIEWICWAHYKNTPLVTPTPGFMETHPNPAIDVHDRLARNPGAHIEPALPNWTELLDEFKAAYRDIWSGGAPARTRLRACQMRIDVLADSAARRLARHGINYP